MRIARSTRLASSCIALFIQYSLVISITVLPLSNRAFAQKKVLPGGRPTTTSHNEAAPSYGPTALADEKRIDESYLGEARGSGLKSAGLPNLAASVMGFANAEQEPVGQTLTPPTPGIGSGGAGPDGSFNVEPPERLQGPPAGVRDTMEVLSDSLTPPGIPDPIPSTEGYCWPGDPACRKRSAPKPPSPAAKPTPPPRPKNASNAPRRRDLLVANNDRYIEKLFSSALPYLAHLWSSDASPYSLLTADSAGSTSRMEPVASLSSVRNIERAGSASSVWADCTYAQGYADGAQLTVYIYVDGVNVGTYWAEWDGYFSYDISAYVNDGNSHTVSAWYYDWAWNWLEAGSTSVSGCAPNYDFDTPRLAPPNETGNPGVNPGSQNINWSVPLVGLPGRGLDLNLLLTYNSLVWTKSGDGAAIMYDADHGFPSPGFRLRFPIIQPQFFNTQVGVTSYMLVTSTGARIELRQVSANTYESADSSLTITQARTGMVTTLVTFGYTSVSFSPSFPGINVIAPTTSTIPVLTQVGFPDGSRYNFEYTTFGPTGSLRRQLRHDQPAVL